MPGGFLYPKPVQNPYDPPRAELVPDPHLGLDSADLFIQTLPSPVLRTASLTWLALGLLSLFLAFRMVLSLVQNPLAGMLEAAEVVVGLAAFGVSTSVVRGSTGVAMVGFGLAPCALGLSVFALLTGSIAGLFGMAFSVFAVGLTAASLKDIAKIGMARRALKRANAVG